MFVIGNRKLAAKLLSEFVDCELKKAYINNTVYFCLRQRVNIAIRVRLLSLGWMLHV
jgi:hypothetical protein